MRESWPLPAASSPARWKRPAGLKIQTIHAFCDALLHRFPLEANVPGHFEQLDDDMIAALIGEARAEMLARIDRGDIEDVADAFRTVIELTGESGLDGLLDEAVQNRSKLVEFLRHMNPANERRAFYLDAFGFTGDDTPERFAADAVAALRAHTPGHARRARCGRRQSRPRPGAVSPKLASPPLTRRTAFDPPSRIAVLHQDGRRQRRRRI